MGAEGWSGLASSGSTARAPLTVAAAQPWSIGGDLVVNVARHAEAVRAANARLVVFPELSLTGYELTAPPLDLAHLSVLEPIRRACGETGSVALVGAPVRDGDGLTYLCCLLVAETDVRVAYRKMWLGGDEALHFTAGTQPGRVLVDGWRLGLGICKDTGVAAQIAATAALGIDAYVAGLVHHAHELPVQDGRGLQIARDHDIFVVFASFAGATGAGYTETAGASTIWNPSGQVVARASARPGDLARARLSVPA